jgi:hypothetical protein
MTRVSSNEVEHSQEERMARGLYLVDDAAYVRAAQHGRLDSLHWGSCAMVEHKHAWRLLRGVIAAASADVYAEARAIADPARRALAGEYQAALAFAFPDEPWGDEAAEALLASAAVRQWSEPSQMVVTVAGLAHGERLARLGFSLELPFLLTLLARHGAAAVPVLAAALDSSNPGGRKEAALALALVRTPEALRAFLPWLGKPGIAQPLARAFKAQPAEAAELLAQLATGTGTSAAAARAILARLT